MSDITVGLFGTCGSSSWRKPFIDYFIKEGINFFNPQLGEGEWNPDFAEEYVRKENEHLKTDDIILFPITDETTGQGSLAEIGFSVMDVTRNLKGRKLIVFIDENCNDPKASDNEIKTSKRSRKLVLSKLMNLSDPNLYIAHNMEDFLELTKLVCTIVLQNYKFSELNKLVISTFKNKTA